MRMKSDNDALGKLPPQAVEVEKAVLGACMIENGAFLHAMKIIKSQEYFYKEAHQLLWSVLKQLYSDREPLDFMTVTVRARKMELLERLGGSQYITALTATTNGADNILSHAAIIREMWAKREVINVAQKTLKEAFEDQSDSQDLLSSLSQGVKNITNGLTNGRQSILGEVAIQVVAEVDERVSKGAKLIEHLSYGDPNVNRLLGGIRRGQPDLMILGARPGMGKSLLAAICIKENAKKGFPVGLITTEMPASQYVKRMMIGEANDYVDCLDGIQRSEVGFVSGFELDNMVISKKQFKAFEVGSSQLYDLKCPIYDKGGPELDEVLSMAHLWKMEFGIELLVIDFLQHIRIKTIKNDRNLEMGEITRALKGLAKELNLPILALSSLNRGVDGRASRRPILSDLRESGDIESDADQVIFLYREGYYDKDANQHNIEWDFAKNRHGKMAVVETQIDLRYSSVIPKTLTKQEVIPFPKKPSTTDEQMPF